MKLPFSVAEITADLEVNDPRESMRMITLVVGVITQVLTRMAIVTAVEKREKVHSSIKRLDCLSGGEMPIHKLKIPSAIFSLQQPFSFWLGEVGVRS